MREMREFNDTIAGYSREVARQGVANLCSGAWTVGTPPFLRRALQEVAADDAAAYAPPNGTDELRGAIAAHYSVPGTSKSICPSEVTVTPGTTGALFLAFAAFFEPGDELLVPIPTYGVSVQAARAAGLQVRQIHAWLPPTEAHGWRLQDYAIRSEITDRTAAILLCDPDNPTGAVLGADDWSRLKAIAEEYDLLLLVDRTYERFPNRKIPVSTAVLADARTVVASSFSKSFRAAGLRIGWLISHQSWSERLAEASTLLFGGVPSPVQAGVTLALASMPPAFFDEQAAHATYLADCLARSLDKIGIAAWPVDGGLFLNVPAQSLGAPSSEEAWRDLLKKGLGGVPSSAFYTGPQFKAHFVRLSFARPRHLLETSVFGNRLVTSA